MGNQNVSSHWMRKERMLRHMVEEIENRELALMAVERLLCLLG